MSALSAPAIILFAHGSRDAQWAQPFKTVQRMMRRKLPGTTVELAFLEIMEPSLAAVIGELVAARHRQITVAPLFLGQGAHLKQDLPRMIDAIRAEHPVTTIRLLPPLGEVNAVLAAISDWLISANAIDE